MFGAWDSCTFGLAARHKLIVLAFTLALLWANCSELPALWTLDLASNNLTTFCERDTDRKPLGEEGYLVGLDTDRGCRVRN